MAVVQYFGPNGQAIGQPIDAANFVRTPIVGDLVFARSFPSSPAMRMQVVGAEHRSMKQGTSIVPALAVFVAPYNPSGHGLMPDIVQDQWLEIPSDN